MSTATTQPKAQDSADGAGAVPPRYRRTEVGVIPEEWETMRLGEVASIRNRKVLPSNVEPDTPCVELEHIGQGDGRLLRPSTAHNSTSAKYRFFVGDVLFGRLRPYLRKFWLTDRSGICTTEIWPLMVNPDRLDSGFLHIIVQSGRFVEAASISYGTHMPRADWGVMRNFEIPLPSLLEQRTIAEALSDVDGLLGALEALIAKKRAIKQATMQQLLTGKTRLPGFSGEWRIVRAGGIGQFRGGSGFPTKFQGATSGDYPFFKVSDMNNEGNETFMETANNYISEELRKQLGATAFPAKSIVFAKVGAAVFLERKKVLSKASCLDNNMAAFVIDDGLTDWRFIHYAFLNIRLGDLVSTTALPSLSGRVLSAIELLLPPVPEQTAIAAVLSDMDAEIDALERRRDKTRAIKQGMMQQLLTGRVRLVKPRRGN